MHANPKGEQCHRRRGRPHRNLPQQEEDSTGCSFGTGLAAYERDGGGCRPHVYGLNGESRPCRNRLTIVADRSLELPGDDMRYALSFLPTPSQVAFGFAESVGHIS